MVLMTVAGCQILTMCHPEVAGGPSVCANEVIMMARHNNATFCLKKMGTMVTQLQIVQMPERPTVQTLGQERELTTKMRDRQLPQRHGLVMAAMRVRRGGVRCIKFSRKETSLPLPLWPQGARWNIPSTLSPSTSRPLLKLVTRACQHPDQCPLGTIPSPPVQWVRDNLTVLGKILTPWVDQHTPWVHRHADRHTQTALLLGT